MDFVVKEAGHLSEELAKEGYANTSQAPWPRLSPCQTNSPATVLGQESPRWFRRHGTWGHTAKKNAAFGLWRSDAGYTTKRLALIVHVVGPFLSAAETEQNGETDWAKFDRIKTQYAGELSRVGPQLGLRGMQRRNLFRSWSNEKVRRHWRRPRARTEARVRRLKWFQKVSERPQVHCQVLAALFGDTLHGPTRASNDCRIIGPIGPWASRVVEDLCSLREGVDSGEEFCDDVDGRWLRLFCSTPVQAIRHV